MTAIDHATRGVTLRTEDGDEFSLVADDAVKNLDQVSEGDVVVATCTEALAYEVIKGGEEANLETTAAAAAAELGQMPGAVAGRSTTLTVTVTAIDTEAPSITFMGPGGNTRTIEVLYPEKLEGVSVGDSVEITYAEALALSVEKVTVPAAPQNVSVVMVTLPPRWYARVGFRQMSHLNNRMCHAWRLSSSGMTSCCEATPGSWRFR